MHIQPKTRRQAHTYTNWNWFSFGFFAIVLRLSIFSTTKSNWNCGFIRMNNGINANIWNSSGVFISKWHTINFTWFFLFIPFHCFSEESLLSPVALRPSSLLLSPVLNLSLPVPFVLACVHPYVSVYARLQYMELLELFVGKLFHISIHWPCFKIRNSTQFVWLVHYRHNFRIEARHASAFDVCVCVCV